MEAAAVEAIFTVFGSALASFMAVRVQIWWIVKTLDRHEKYHESHFTRFRNLPCLKNLSS